MSTTTSLAEALATYTRDAYSLGGFLAAQELAEAVRAELARSAAGTDVFTALHDYPEDAMSAHIGVFSTEEKARDACQEHADGDWESQRHLQPEAPRPILEWEDDRARMQDGCTYTVIRTRLDVPAGAG